MKSCWQFEQDRFINSARRLCGGALKCLMTLRCREVPVKVALQTTQCTAAGTGTGMLMAPLATVAGKPGFTDGEPLDEGVSVLARR